MKKIYLLVTLLVNTVFANAQIKQGSFLVGGQLGFNRANYDAPNQPQQKFRNTNFNTSAGKAYKDNAVYGFAIGYLHGSNTNSFNGTNYASSKINGYNAGVFYRSYRNLTSNFYFFGAATAGYFGTKQTTTFSNNADATKNINKSVQLSFAPGLSYAVSKNLQLEIQLPDMIGVSYNRGKSVMGTAESISKSFGINSTLNSSFLNNLGVGFRLIL